MPEIWIARTHQTLWESKQTGGPGGDGIALLSLRQSLLAKIPSPVMKDGPAVLLQFCEIILTIISGLRQIQTTLQCGGEGDDLEYGAKRILSLGGAIDQRLFIAVDQIAQCILTLGIGRVEQIRVKPW